MDRVIIALHCSIHSMDILFLRRSRLNQIGWGFADDFSTCIILIGIAIQISPIFLPKCPIGNTSALVLVMAWHETGAKPLPEPVMAHKCVTCPQSVRQIWAKILKPFLDNFITKMLKFVQIGHNLSHLSKFPCFVSAGVDIFVSILTFIFTLSYNVSSGIDSISNYEFLVA